MFASGIEGNTGMITPDTPEPMKDWSVNYVALEMTGTLVARIYIGIMIILKNLF